MNDHDTDVEDESADYWLTEHPQAGLERNWARQRRPYATEGTDRDRIAVSIGTIRWYRLDDRVPFSTGLILQELITRVHHAGLNPLAMGISSDSLEYPEPHLVDKPRNEVHPDFFETGYLVALRQLCKRTVLSAYYLVLGDEAGQVVLDIEDRPLPDVRMTQACAAHLHELCLGAIGDESCECPCGKHPAPSAQS